MFNKNKPLETFLVDPSKMQKDEVLRLPENARKIRLENSNDRLFYRVYGDIKQPDAQIIVADRNKVVITRDGVSSGVLSGGKYNVYEDDQIKKGLFGGKKLREPVVIDVTVYNPNLTYEGHWGTVTPIPWRDPETQIAVDIKGNGRYDIRIADVEKFHERLVGSERDFTMDKLLDRVNDYVYQVVKAEFAKVIHDLHLGYIDLPRHEMDIAEKIQPIVSEMLNEQYGLYVPIFAINAFTIDEGKRAKIEQYLEDNRDEEKFKKDAKEIAAEIERLDDKQWEREKYLIGLKREDYDKYLEVTKILGWRDAKDEKKEKEEKGAKYCPKCGKPVEHGQTFCSNCGTQLEVTEKVCPHCGCIIKTKGKYCPNCGKEL